MINVYNLVSVITLDTKAMSLRRIHFAEKLTEEYKEQKADLKVKICADALLFAIKETDYYAAYLDTVPTEENLKRRLENPLPDFFNWNESSEEQKIQETKQEMEEEANVYHDKYSRSYDLRSHLIGYFDDDMANLYDYLYSCLMSAFEQAEEKHDDWNNYSLLR